MGVSVWLGRATPFMDSPPPGPGASAKHHSPAVRKLASKVAAAIASTAALHEHAKSTSARKTRRFLHCSKCANMVGMCESCREIFITGRWRDVHHGWKKVEKETDVGKIESTRPLENDRRTFQEQKSMPNSRETIRTNSSSPTELERLRNEKAALHAALLAAQRREDYLVDELDGYKRALRFARNFIETEHESARERVVRKPQLSKNEKLQRLVDVYREQLSRLSSDNQRLAFALEQSVAATQPDELRAIQGQPVPGSSWSLGII